MKIFKQHSWITQFQFLVFATLVGLAGCDSGGDNGNDSGSSRSNDRSSVGSSSSATSSESPDPQPEIQSYDVPLEGEQEVPMVHTEQTARATLTVDETGLMIVAEMDRRSGCQ